MKRQSNHGYPRVHHSIALKAGAAERAYMVVAGVLKDWKALGEPVVLGMDYLIVKGHDEGYSPLHHVEPVAKTR